MTYLVLARRYRPQTLEQVVGQDHVTLTLENAISNDRVAHSILFSGPKGTGKTTVARIMAKAMNCKSDLKYRPCNECESCNNIVYGKGTDVVEIDAASNNSVDQIRNLQENIRYMPANSRLKIYIIDEIHMLSGSAFNALLKTLEEPPLHVMFLIATTEYHKIPSTILSRCQHYSLKRIATKLIEKHLSKICEIEAFKIDPQILWEISNKSDGSIRDALSLLDQIMAYHDSNMSYDQASNILGLINKNMVHSMVDAIFFKKTNSILNIINSAYEYGYDLKLFYDNILEQLRHLIILKIGNNVKKLINVSSNDIIIMQNQIKNVTILYMNQILSVLSKEENYIRSTNNSKLALEIAFLKLHSINTALPIDTLIESLNYFKKKDVNSKSNSFSKTKILCKKTSINNENSTKKIINLKESNNTILVADKDNDIEKIWCKVKEVLFKSKPSLATSLSHCLLHKMNGNSIEIEVTKNEYTMNILEKNFAIIQKAMQKYFDPKVVITIKNNINNKIKYSSKNNKIKKNIHTEIIDYPLVNDSLRIFNGKIKDVKVDFQKKESNHYYEKHGQYDETSAKNTVKNDESSE